MSCMERAGERFLNTLTVCPVFREAYEALNQSVVSSDEIDRHRTVMNST